MSQQYAMPPAGTDKAGTVLKTVIPNALDALLTEFSGATAPTTTYAYMRWLDTANGWLKRRNAGNTAWDILGPITGLARSEFRVEFLAVSATTRKRVLSVAQGFYVERITLLAAAATTGSSSGNEWKVRVYNETAANDLFSAQPGTFTAVGGVGGGAELAANTPFVLTPNQNDTLSAGDVLSLELTKVGTPGTSPLTEIVALVQGFRRA